ncbi:GNAT family N-acetyltransferase [Acinetobacter junii]|uniref:GNAT family N-acetyltransferase n=1 Tax=Acinetobacter junii TaxID=40215 RepID=UPI00124FD494|nr:GNAT family N-acetyltransferase [Acinetobacter junii]
MISVRREKWIDCIDQIMPLCQQVFDLEEAQFTGLPLEFDTDMYLESEESNYFHCLVLRKNGKPIGFHWIVISPMPRHMGKTHAHTDAIFVDPENRQHSNTLLEFSEQYIKERADFWTLANLGVNDRQALWQRKGFKPIETIMFKKL